jgi:murein DD-endopeptidase MepM/ murein hydrolase activator NlpD
MVISRDFNLDKLLQETIDLFRGQQKPVNPRLRPDQQRDVQNIQAPIKGSWLSSGGFSLQPTDKRHPNGHMGVDMRAPAGTPIYSMAPGTVTRVGSSSLGGNTINIQHANGLRSYYAHCSTVKVHEGDRVNNNTVIATVGDSGNAKGTVPHLHFQVWKDNQIQDPAAFFSVPKYVPYDTKKEKFWLSDQAKQEAAAFNMKSHLANRRVAFSKNVQRLVKIAEKYYNLSKDY